MFENACSLQHNSASTDGQVETRREGRTKPRQSPSGANDRQRHRYKVVGLGSLYTYKSIFFSFFFSLSYSLSSASLFWVESPRAKFFFFPPSLHILRFSREEEEEEKEVSEKSICPIWNILGRPYQTEEEEWKRKKKSQHNNNNPPAAQWRWRAITNNKYHDMYNIRNENFSL